MLIWHTILIILIISTGSGLIYLSSRVYKFSFIKRAARGKPGMDKFLSLTVVVLAFLLLCLILNVMNAVICLIHITAFWLLSDILFAIAGRFKRKPFTKYYAGSVAVITAAVYLSVGCFQDYHVWKTAYVINTNKDIKDLRIIQFADSHIGTTFDSNGFAKHLKKMQKQNPDIVLITGDFVDDGTTREEMIAACKALGNLKTTYGVYFAFGNHDKGYYNPVLRGFTGNELTAELEKNGVRVLQDQNILIGDEFYIIGRKDASETHRGGFRKNMKELTQNLNKNKFIIVMDHQPNDYKKQTEAEVDLVLSGHTHGGQLFPLNKVGEWIGANDKTYGLEKRNQTSFIVTSGLSNWAMKFKTGCKSEFVVIDIKQKN